MGVTVVNKNYSTRNFAGGNNFALSNVTQFVTDKVDIIEDYDFESSMQNQVLIVSEFTIQILGASWTEKGMSIGDDLEFSGTIINGGNTVTYTDKPFTVVDLQGDLLTLDATLEDPVPNPPQYTSSVVGQMMPAPSGVTSNTTLVIVNTTVTESQSIEVFHNLVQNNAQGSDLSLFDGEVNRFRADSLTGLAVSGTINMVQMGFQSGGTYKSVILTRLADVNSKRSYEIEFIYANPYKFADSDFDEPSQYSASASVKPYYRFLCLPVSNNPNSFLELTHAVQMGNLGWYDESYNQGVNTFVVESVTITDVSLVQLNELDYSQTNIVTVVISGDSTFLEKVEGEFYLIPPANTVKEQPNSNGDNTSLSNFFYDTTGPTVIEIDVFGNNLATIPSLAHSIVLGVNEITISFRLNPTAGFETLVDGMNANERLYRVALNVESHGGTANENNAVSLIVIEGLMEKAPLIGGAFTGLRTQIFYNHKNDIAGAGSVTYEGNTEDDVLYYANMDFDKADVWTSATVDVRVTRTSDGQFFKLFEQPVSFTPYVTTPDGVQQIQFLQNVEQFLDAPNRNKFEISVNGNDTPTTYEVDIIFPFFMNWRDWIPELNAFVDFYDNTLPNNGLSKEYIRYLEIAGYTLSVEVTLIDDASTAFNFGSDITLVDYDDTVDVTTTVLYYDENDDLTPEFIDGQTNRIEATHVKNSGNWNQTDAWAWISSRPLEDEPNKRISSFWPWTSQDLPLKPLTGETGAKITYPSANVAVVECLIDATMLTDSTSIIVKIDEAK